MDGETELVTLSIATQDEISRRMLRAIDGKRQGSHITFQSVEVLWKVISPKRLEILRAMAGQGPLAIREVARRVARDVKAVHGDVQGLLDAGLLESESEGVVFPYAGCAWTSPFGLRDGDGCAQSGSTSRAISVEPLEETVRKSRETTR